MGSIVVQLFAIFAPIVADIIKQHQAEHPGTPLPTDEEVIALFNANIDKYLAEGSAWLEQHPKPPA